MQHSRQNVEGAAHRAARGRADRRAAAGGNRATCDQGFRRGVRVTLARPQVGAPLSWRSTIAAYVDHPLALKAGAAAPIR